MADPLKWPSARQPLVDERRLTDPVWYRQLLLLQDKIAALEATAADHETRISDLEPP